MALIIEAAGIQDLADIRALLAEGNLPSEDIADHLSAFLVAREGRTLVGTIGMEIMPPIGLLRSLAVTARARGKGAGAALTRDLLARARHKGLSAVYLLTTSAGDYFAKRGWTQLDRADAPDAIRATLQFQGLCPGSAICMKLALT